MKIFRNNTLYVEKKDLIYLLSFNIDIPKELKEKLERINLNETNQHEFVRFTAEEEINYYNNLSWIIDYDDYIKLTEEEIFETANKIQRRINIILNNKIKKEEKAEKRKEYKELSLKMQALRDAYLLKRGYANINIPTIDKIKR